MSADRNCHTCHGLGCDGAGMTACADCGKAPPMVRADVSRAHGAGGQARTDSDGTRTHRGPPKKDGKLINVRVPEATWLMLCKLAEAESRSATMQARHVLMSWVNKEAERRWPL